MLSNAIPGKPAGSAPFNSEAFPDIAQGEAQRPDFSIAHHGGISILNPLSDAARSWVNDNLPEDAMRWGSGVVIEPRYLCNIIEAADADGLTFE